MANVNTFAGYQSLPVMANPNTTTEFAYVVPAAGSYPGLPNPWMAAGVGLVVSALPGDVDTTASTAALRYAADPLGSNDAHPFKVRACVKFYSHTTQNLTIRIFQVPFSIFQAGTQGTLANDNVIATSGALAAGNGVWGAGFLEATCTWDSVSQKLQALSNAMIQGAVISSGVVTGASATGVAENDLNFVVAFTLSSGTTADLIYLSEFAIDRY